MDLIKRFREETGFQKEIPEQLEDMIHQLEEAIKNKDLIIDCIQDEIHSLCRYYDNDEDELTFINFFCYRRWY